MIKNLKKIKGTQDFYGQKLLILEKIRLVFLEKLKIYNYNFLELPVFEKYDLFARTAGENSDIVTKEMYVFDDKKNRKIALRPEGTAQVLRFFLENKMYLKNDYKKVAYFGKMYRYEQPQKDRYREFFQAGVENFKDTCPENDVEVIIFLDDFLKSLDVKKNLVLKINFLGTQKEIFLYKKNLEKYFFAYWDQLSETSKVRLRSNPLRIIDDKKEKQKKFVKDCPKIIDFLSQESKIYFKKIQSILKTLKIDFEVDLNLVRGLDYYSGLVFEYLNNDFSGSQNAVAGGGRYDDFLNFFKLPKKSGIGFAVGVDRIINLMTEKKHASKENKILITANNVFYENQNFLILQLANFLRKKIGKNENIFVETNFKNKNIKKNFEYFYKNSYEVMLIFTQDFKEIEIIYKNKDHEKLKNTKINYEEIYQKIWKYFGN